MHVFKKLYLVFFGVLRNVAATWWAENIQDFVVLLEEADVFKSVSSVEVEFLADEDMLGKSWQ